jgi:protein involved in polysaccharide export with SLBB domain
MKHILFLLLLLSITPILLAQTVPVNPATVDVNSLNDAQVQRVAQEIQTRGLSPEQASALAKANGVSQTQIDQMMARMQQQGTKPGTTGTSSAASEPATEGTYSVPKGEAKISEKAKRIFGYHLFNTQSLTFEPGVNIPISKNYILGIGDQLTINVWGASQQKYMLTIDKTGSITIPDVGPVNLSGVSLERGIDLIKSRLMGIYNGMAGSSPNTWAEVTLGTGHSIKINVIGEVNTPGTYTLPSTATAFNALYLSGGPNEKGSFREIRLIRDGATIKTFDVYDFLINGDPAANFQLREQDILLIPNYKTRVEIGGEVKHEGLFEIKSDETLADLIRFAGGFSEQAYTGSLTVIRNNEREREIRNVDNANYGKFALKTGDVISITSILDRFSNRVSIMGAVYHPGNFELTRDMKLSDLIKKADGIRGDAFMNRALITRLKPDNTLENISFDPKQVLAGSFDPLLQKEDVVQIQSIFDLREAQDINITGEVLRPGSFEYNDNLTLGDLIFKAGGFREDADLSGVEVVRRLSYEEAAKINDKMNEVYKFSLTREMKLSAADATFRLKPFDAVYVRRAPGSMIQGTFTITGEVTYTGTYAISSKKERISDAVQRAGGLIPGAFVEGATLNRTTKLSEAEIEKKRILMRMDTTIKGEIFLETRNSVGIELGKILTDPGSTIDLLLQPGDEIYIPRQLQTIKVSGNVRNPLALTYEKRLSLSKYIDMAGGYGERSRKSHVYVLYPNGTTASTRGFIFKFKPRVTPGSEIIVPKKPDTKGTDNAMKWVSIASALSSLTLTVVTIVTLTK